MPSPKKASSPKKSQKGKQEGPTKEEIKAEEEAKARREADLAAVTPYISSTIAALVSQASSQGGSNYLDTRAVPYAASVLLSTTFLLLSAVSPNLKYDVGDGDATVASVLLGRGEEPAPPPVDRQATRSLSTSDTISPFLHTLKNPSPLPPPSQPSSPAKRPPLSQSASQVDVKTGPAAYGFRSLQSDPRADVDRLCTLFDVIDLDSSSTITLDEMQWFLELQGQPVKRTEFQQCVESLGVVGANAPLTRRVFVQFCLSRLEGDPKCSFEVREVPAVPDDADRVSDSKMLKKLLARAEEEKKKAAAGKVRKPGAWKGTVSAGRGSQLKTEYVVKTWEELEALARSIPPRSSLSVERIEDWKPEKEEMVREVAAGENNSKKKKGKKKGGGTKRPETAPSAGRAAAAASEDSSDGGRSAFDPYYVKAPSLQRPIGEQESLDVAGGVVIKQQLPDRPSTATVRGGGRYPHDRERMSREQFERKMNPDVDGDDGEHEEGGGKGGVSGEGSSKLSGGSRGEQSGSGRVCRSPTSEILAVGADGAEGEDPKLKSGRRSESPTTPDVGLRSSPVLSLSVSPALLRKADETARTKFAEEVELQKGFKVLAERERTQLGEVKTGGSSEPALPKLPPKEVRMIRGDLKKLATPFALRDRPKSATGRVNGARAMLRMQRAQEFDRMYAEELKRPSTASGQELR